MNGLDAGAELATQLGALAQRDDVRLWMIAGGALEHAPSFDARAMVLVLDERDGVLHVEICPRGLPQLLALAEQYAPTGRERAWLRVLTRPPLDGYALLVWRARDGVTGVLSVPVRCTSPGGVA